MSQVWITDANIWIAAANRRDAKGFIVRADEKPTGFLERVSAILANCPSSVALPSQTIWPVFFELYRGW